MKRLLLFFKWLIYVWATQDERQRWMFGKIKGRHCIRIDRRLNYKDLYFDKNKEPEREFLVRKEWFKLMSA